MALSIELSPETEQQLRAEAARKGLTPEEFARTAVEETLAAAVAAQVERNRGLVEILRQWREEPPDLEEAEGYPLAITPLFLREVSVE
jgi:hypothetical protein